MARTTPRVDVNRLVLPSHEHEESPITVGTTAWFDWLQGANTFAFTSPLGSFTARKEARARLFERIEAGLRGKLTLIAAPAGFGKTTLLSAWRTTNEGSKIQFAWVSLDSTDNDPRLFWSYVLSALDSVSPGVCAPALA